MSPPPPEPGAGEEPGRRAVATAGSALRSFASLILDAAAGRAGWPEVEDASEELAEVLVAELGYDASVAIGDDPRVRELSREIDALTDDEDEPLDRRLALREYGQVCAEVSRRLPADRTFDPVRVSAYVRELLGELDRLRHFEEHVRGVLRESRERAESGEARGDGEEAGLLRSAIEGGMPE